MDLWRLRKKYARSLSMKTIKTYRVRWLASHALTSWSILRALCHFVWQVLENTHGRFRLFRLLLWCRWRTRGHLRQSNHCLTFPQRWFRLILPFVLQKTLGRKVPLNRGIFFTGAFLVRFDFDGILMAKNRGGDEIFQAGYTGQIWHWSASQPKHHVLAPRQGFSFCQLIGGPFCRED